MIGRVTSPLVLLVAQTAVVFTLLFGLLDGRHRDFHVPLEFSHDALEYLMQVKGTIDHGWWWSNARLSAPGTFQQIAYPSNTNVDQALVWVVHLFTHDAPLCLNVSWMILVSIAAPIATLCLLRLGLTRPIAYLAGVLYALSPYALYRHIEHFALVIYLVPIPCTVALLIATGRLGGVRSRANAALVVGCALLGFNYVYYAFFGSFVIGVAALIGWMNERDARALRRGVAFLGVIAVATAINLAPSFVSWSAHGKPLVIPEKTTAEAETYGLKIRQLVSPTLEHPFAPFRAYTDAEQRARYPLETENAKSRLGLLETMGFALLLASLFTPKALATWSDASLLASAGRLTLAVLLLGTIGGFGSIFNLLVSTEIRAYNRLCAFIAFFAWVALGLALQRVMTSRAGSRPARSWAPFALVVILVIGLVDQGPAVAPLNAAYQATHEELTGLRWFVDSFEQKLPPGAMVFQLPVTTYLNDHGLVQMLPYDHIKPYVVSQRAHWSYPALDNADVRWQHAVGRLAPADLATALAAQGFTAIVVDRYGYGDGGQALLAALGARDVADAVMAESGRYVAVDVRLIPKSTFDVRRLPSLDATFPPASSALPLCAGDAVQAIEQVGPQLGPFSSDPIPVTKSSDLTVRGWAVDDVARRAAGDVDIVLDDEPLGTFSGVDRRDIAERFHLPAYTDAGFLARISRARLRSGRHTLSLRVVSADRQCAFKSAPLAIVVQ